MTPLHRAKARKILDILLNKIDVEKLKDLEGDERCLEEKKLGCCDRFFTCFGLKEDEENVMPKGDNELDERKGKSEKN